ncbi:hypothetical protein ES705_29907 [subsurface metagenome]
MSDSVIRDALTSAVSTVASDLGSRAFSYAFGDSDVRRSTRRGDNEMTRGRVIGDSALLQKKPRKLKLVLGPSMSTNNMGLLNQILNRSTSLSIDSGFAYTAALGKRVFHFQHFRHSIHDYLQTDPTAYASRPTSTGGAAANVMQPDASTLASPDRVSPYVPVGAPSSDPHLGSPSYYSCLTLSDLENTSYHIQTGKELIEKQVDTVSVGGGPADQTTVNTSWHAIAQNIVGRDFCTKSQIWKDNLVRRTRFPNEGYGSTSSAVHRHDPRIQSKAVLKSGKVEYQFTNAEGMPAVVTLVVYKVRKGYGGTQAIDPGTSDDVAAPSGEGHSTSAAVEPTPGEDPCISHYEWDQYTGTYPVYWDCQTHEPVPAPSPAPAPTNPVSSSIANRFQNDKLQHAHVEALTQAYMAKDHPGGPKMFGGKSRSVEDITSNANHQFLPNMKGVPASLAPFIEKERINFVLAAGETRDIIIQLPGEVYDPTQVDKEAYALVDGIATNVSSDSYYENLVATSTQSGIAALTKQWTPMQYSIAIAVSGAQTLQAVTTTSSAGVESGVIEGQTTSIARVTCRSRYTENIGAMHMTYASRKSSMQSILADVQKSGSSNAHGATVFPVQEMRPTPGGPQVNLQNSFVQEL